MSDEPTPELRALAARLFRAGRIERPGPALGRRLLLIEGQRDSATPAPRTATGTLADAAVPARRGLTPSRLALWLAAAALLGGGIGGWFALGPRPIPISAESAGSAHARASAARVSAARAVVDEGAETSAGAAVDLFAANSDGRSESARTPSDAATAPPLAGPPPNDAPPRRVPSAARKTTRAAATRVAATPAAAAPLSVPQPAAARSSSSEPAPHSLLDELELLKGARSALRSGEAARALELLERHTRERRSLGLDAEATLLRIETYAALGRDDEASELAARFVRDNPNSALGDRAKTFIRRGPTKAHAP